MCEQICLCNSFALSRTTSVKRLTAEFYKQDIFFLIFGEVNI